MPEPTLRGTLEPKRQFYSESYDPETGWLKQWNWKSFSLPRVRAFAYAYQRAGCATHLSLVNDTAVLEVRDTTGGITIDRWEIDAEQANRSSLINPLHAAGASPISANDLQVIATAVENGMDFKQTISFLSKNGLGPATIPTNARSLRLYRRLLNREPEYEFDLYTLIHTTNVSNRYAANVADLHKGRIYTTAQLLSEVTDADSWVFPLPDRLVYKIQALYVDASTAMPAPDNYGWGWLKSASTERSAANNRIDIATLYKFDLWSLDEYLTW